MNAGTVILIGIVCLVSGVAIGFIWEYYRSKAIQQEQRELYARLLRDRNALRAQAYRTQATPAD